ncbi:MAG: DUF4238 domain-containing protein [Rhodospirillales bacterium]|nr:DUF4238 domain-containing protein [Rhodospirillales bacterium]
MNKKRHHYVPKAYLKSFCDEGGKVRIYRKDAPQKIIHQSPDNTGFHKYYYSQPLPGGGRDNDSLEDLFSKFEEKWPPLVDRLRRRDNINDRESLRTLLDFISLQRVRVPATRDAVEKSRAEEVMSTLRIMDAKGMLPPKPEGHEDILDKLAVAIDPHQSLLAMEDLIEGFNKLFNEIGLGALHNTTDKPFLTSDNPVIWFDPSVSEAEMLPYVWRPGGPVVLLFPIASDCMVYGHTSMREQFALHGFTHGELSDVDAIKTMNIQICRFAYETVFAGQPGQEPLIQKHSKVSPILQSSTVPLGEGEIIVLQNVFGAREPKPKWED